MQSGREDTIEKRFEIKCCFKLGKNATETYGMLQTPFGPSCMNRASVCEWHKRYKEGKESVGNDERCGRSKEVNTPELISQLVLELGILCWGFKGIQEEIPSEQANMLQIGSVTFPVGQCTRPQLHPCHRLFDQDWHQEVSHPPYSLDLAPCDFLLFSKLRGCSYEAIEKMKDAVTIVIDALKQADFHVAFPKLFERYN